MVRILGFGDNVVDRYVNMNIMYPGGNAVNVAVYTSMLGAQSGYLGIYGNDRAGRVIREALDDLGINQDRVRILDGETGYSDVTLVNGDRTYVGSNKGGVYRDNLLLIEEEDRDYIENYQLVHTSCYSYVESQLPVLKAMKPFVSFDFSNLFDYEYAGRVCPYVDISLISCGDMAENEVEEVIGTAQSKGCPMVIASMGSRGAFIAMEEKRFRQPAKLVDAKDTLGAGDAFFSAYIYDYLERGGTFDANEENYAIIEKAMDRAACFSSEIVMRDGAFGYGTTINQ